MTIVKSKAGTRGMRGSRWAALLARVLRPVMIRHHRRSGDQFRGRPVLYLTTVGARTGAQRQSAVGYEPDGEGAWLVVASFEQLEGPRRAEAWAQAIASRPSMAGYQEKTDRVLPVLRLTRVG